MDAEIHVDDHPITDEEAVVLYENSDYFRQLVEDTHNHIHDYPIELIAELREG